MAEGITSKALLQIHPRDRLKDFEGSVRCSERVEDTQCKLGTFGQSLQVSFALLPEVVELDARCVARCFIVPASLPTCILTLKNGRSEVSRT